MNLQNSTGGGGEGVGGDCKTHGDLLLAPVWGQDGAAQQGTAAPGVGSAWAPVQGCRPGLFLPPRGGQSVLKQHSPSLALTTRLRARIQERCLGLFKPFSS